MIISDLVNYIDKVAPFDTVEEYDNAGLIVGDCNAHVNRVLVCVDLTTSVIAQATREGINTIVSHHPLIFNAINNIQFNNPIGKIIKQLIKNDINYIAVHTNFDRCEIGNSIETLKMLNLGEVKATAFDPYGAELIAKNPISIEALHQLIIAKTGDTMLRTYNFGNNIIKRIAYFAGSCGRDEELLLQLSSNYDILISSEFKHSNLVLAKELGINIMDISHGKGECVFVESMSNYLKSTGIQITTCKEVL